MQGIVETLVHPADDEDKTPWPFLGDMAMDYLCSHGYNTQSVLHIAFLCRILNGADAECIIVYYE